jgi:hypothetical protein
MLSEYEQRLFGDIERALKEDPQFAAATTIRPPWPPWWRIDRWSWLVLNGLLKLLGRTGSLLCGWAVKAVRPDRRLRPKWTAGLKPAQSRSRRRRLKPSVNWVPLFRVAIVSLRAATVILVGLGAWKALELAGWVN